MASGAAKRLANHSVDWARISNVLLENLKPSFNSFKSTSELYARKVGELPSSLEPIDFSMYKRRLSSNLLPIVDAIERQYQSFDVAYPKDGENMMSKVNEQEKERMADAKKQIEQSLLRVKEHDEKLAIWDKIPPLEHMTDWEWNEYFPHACVKDPMEITLDWITAPFYRLTPEEFMQSANYRVDPAANPNTH